MSIGDTRWPETLAAHFRSRGQGMFIGVSSNAAHVPSAGMAAYGASKAALTSLVKAVGLELAPLGIRCNLLSPGSTDTPMLSRRGPLSGVGRGAPYYGAGSGD